MNKITVGKLFELYVDTLEKCGKGTKSLSDELIEYNIFEEFIVGITSFLANNSLDDLLDNGIIDEQIFSDSQKLRIQTLTLDGSDLWNISSFRGAESWAEIMTLSDEIKRQIHQKWNEQEIQQIFKL